MAKKKDNLKIFEDFFKKYKHDGSLIVLDQCTTIIDLDKFVESTIFLLRSNSGKKLFKPYYDRILNLYNLLNKTQKP